MIDWDALSADQLLRHVRDDRMEADQIGARYGVTEDRVVARLVALGISVKGWSGRARTLHALSDAVFRERLLSLGGAELARRLGVDRQTVQRRQIRLGIVLPRGRRRRDGNFIGRTEGE